MGKMMMNLLFLGILNLAPAAGWVAAQERSQTRQDAPSGEPGKQPSTSGSQSQSMAEMHHGGSTQGLKPDLPKMGRGQDKPMGRLFHLGDIEHMALQHNPTLLQADAEIQMSKARQQQSGLYPNPRVGYAGDEIRGGSFGGGEQGFFVSQSIVTAGKLGLNRKIFGQDLRISELEAQEQRLRVMNAVHIAYYRELAAQELLATKKDIAHIAAESLKTQQQLQNTGQADDSEVLQVEIDQQKAEMEVLTQQSALEEEWRALAAVVGDPNLAMGTVAGILDQDLPAIEEEQAVAKLLRESPAVAIAQAGVERSQVTLTRAKREPIPDIDVRAGLSQSGELLEPSARATGLLGFAEVGVQIPLFNRNQGNVEAARQDIQRATAEQKRVELVLRERGAAALERYRTSEVRVNQYRNQLLPRGEKAYGLLLHKYGLMLASYPQVLKVERMLYDLHSDYISALEELWVSGLTVNGLLLTDGLEAPSRPGDVDRPVREINVPAGRP